MYVWTLFTTSSVLHHSQTFSYYSMQSIQEHPYPIYNSETSLKESPEAIKST